jgi:hypothetical protein
LALGLVWTRLHLGGIASRLAFWLLVYSTFAILAAYVLAAFWGVGNGTMPMAAGTAHGNHVQESVIKAERYSCPPTGIVSLGVILWVFACRTTDDDLMRS